jgi:DMSO/TMAO reductase YedYZ molybdopterin-dependent catalytic subunit
MDPLSRRRFLAWGAAGGIATLCPAVGTKLYGQSVVSKERLIVRSVRPQDLETPVSLLDSWITPNDLFYVRSHLYTPEIDPQKWTLKIDGEVELPLSLGLEDLRRMPRASLAVTLECAGNGRAYFDPPVAGVQWEKGAVGTARWTGVRLADVLKKAGLKSAARHVYLDGADVPIGKMPDFIRNLPLEKAMHPDTLLAYEMNGAALPIQHGFPLRAIVPGWEGAYAVKWLKQIQVSQREHDGFFVATAYRFPKRNVAPGSAVDPKEMAPLTGLAVKSIITAPLDGATVRQGPVLVRGFAWAGEAKITRVDLSFDGGITWQAARLGAEQERYAWRQFEYSWRAAEPGAWLALSRATDDQGRVQPMVARWNPSGYLWNVIDRVRVNVQGS